MSFQFIRTEAYSRKADNGNRTVAWILDEVERNPSACSHIANPEPPTIVFGSSVAELRSLHDHAVVNAKITISSGHTRAISSAQNTLLTIVASHPFEPREVRESKEKMDEYESWEIDTVRWLKVKYGEAFKLAVRHMDESHMHIHAYVLPSDLKANDIHPGARAKRFQRETAIKQGLGPKLADKIGDDAYKAAMTEWQKSYYEEVSAKHGFSEDGPSLKRLTRAEWYQEKINAQLAQAKALGPA